MLKEAFLATTLISVGTYYRESESVILLPVICVLVITPKQINVARFLFLCVTVFLYVEQATQIIIPHLLTAITVGLYTR